MTFCTPPPLRPGATIPCSAYNDQETCNSKSEDGTDCVYNSEFFFCIKEGTFFLQFH